MKTRNIILTGGSILIATTITFIAFKTISSTTKTKMQQKTLAKKETIKHLSVQASVAPSKPKQISAKKIRATKHTSSLPKKTTDHPGIPKLLFTTDYLPLQEFSINPERDTLLEAKGGMSVSIPKNAFAFKDGSPAKEKVTVQIKEAFSQEDIVFANLLTKKGKELLESGGMFYINAVCQNENLIIAGDKQLKVEVPTPSLVKGMELYEGNQNGEALDWQNPLKLTKNEALMETALTDADENFAISPFRKKLATNKAAPNQNTRIDSLGWISRKTEGFRFMDGNMNDGRQDKTLKYVMETKRLGWANIDCLFHDPRSRQISFVTEVLNKETFDDVFISMMFKTKRVYLPGYKKADGTYSFTHGDYEAPFMPVGEKAIIMVSAHKNGQQYFDVQEITITDNTFVAMDPAQASMEQIKDRVKKAL